MAHKFEEFSDSTIVFGVVSNAFLDVLQGYGRLVETHKVLVLKLVARHNWGVSASQVPLIFQVHG
jgi:hypothetical protein